MLEKKNENEIKLQKKLSIIQFFYRFSTIWRTAALLYRSRALPYHSNFYRKEREKVTHAWGTVTLFDKNR